MFVLSGVRFSVALVFLFRFRIDRKCLGTGSEKLKLTPARLFPIDVRAKLRRAEK